MQGKRENAMIGQQGSRFASATGQLQADAGLRRATEFDLFSANLANMFGQQQTQALQGAGQFQLGQQGMQAQLMQQLLAALLQGGGITQDPAFTSQPSWMSQLAGAGASIAAATKSGG